MKQRGNGKNGAAAVSLFVLCALFLGGMPAKGAGYAPDKLIPVGHTVGIKLFSEGVLVVGLSEIKNEAGSCTPAKDCGLQVGDVIVSADGDEIESTEHFRSVVAESAGEELDLTVRRDGETLALCARAAEGSDGTVRLGAWVRDSLAGIGTMTFYDPKTGRFGALGHGINDVDTRVLMPLEEGSIMYSTVKAVKPGEAGSPGELRGNFDLKRDLGVLSANTERGVFGTVAAENFPWKGQAVAVAAPEEVTCGEAEILSNISGDSVEHYQIEIQKICRQNAEGSHFVIKVTDERLLAATGGIVQGMSGSPIIQNGRIVGAVTHVLVNDPTRGYGIFIENMLDAAG